MVVQSVRERIELSEGTDAEFPQRRTLVELQEEYSSVHRVMQEGTDIISSYTRNTKQVEEKEVFEQME